MNSIRGKVINHNQEIKGEITFDNKILEVKETSEMLKIILFQVLLIFTVMEDRDTK